MVVPALQVSAIYMLTIQAKIQLIHKEIKMRVYKTPFMATDLFNFFFASGLTKARRVLMQLYWHILSEVHCWLQYKRADTVCDNGGIQ